MSFFTFLHSVALRLVHSVSTQSCDLLILTFLALSVSLLKKVSSKLGVSPSVCASLSSHFRTPLVVLFLQTVPRRQGARKVFWQQGVLTETSSVFGWLSEVGAVVMYPHFQRLRCDSLAGIHSCESLAETGSSIPRALAPPHGRMLAETPIVVFVDRVIFYQFPSELVPHRVVPRLPPLSCSVRS